MGKERLRKGQSQLVVKDNQRQEGGKGKSFFSLHKFVFRRKMQSINWNLIWSRDAPVEKCSYQGLSTIVTGTLDQAFRHVFLLEFENAVTPGQETAPYSRLPSGFGCKLVLWAGESPVDGTLGELL